MVFSILPPPFAARIPFGKVFLVPERGLFLRFFVFLRRRRFSRPNSDIFVCCFCSLCVFHRNSIWQKFVQNFELQTDNIYEQAGKH